jgi:uncharacterized protein (TIGR00369 family)
MSERASRTYEYEGRATDVKHMTSMSGLDFMRGIITGETPAAPMAGTLGFRPIEFELGKAVFVGTPERFTYNPLGIVHGGWAATLLDSAMGCAVHTALPAGKSYTTVELSVNYVRGMTDRTGQVRCEAQVIHMGGSLATAEGRVLGADGTLYAHGKTTCLILTPRT